MPESVVTARWTCPLGRSREAFDALPSSLRNLDFVRVRLQPVYGETQLNQAPGNDSQTERKDDPRFRLREIGKARITLAEPMTSAGPTGTREPPAFSHAAAHGRPPHLLCGFRKRVEVARPVEEEGTRCGDADERIRAQPLRGTEFGCGLLLRDCESPEHSPARPRVSTEKEVDSR